MLVKANRVGFYDGLIRRPGDEFEISSKKELGSWMTLTRKPQTRNKTVAKEAKPDENTSSE